MMHLILVIAVVIILAASYVPRVPMLRARLQDSRRGGAA